MVDQIAMVKELTNTDVDTSLFVLKKSLQHFKDAGGAERRFKVVDIDNDQQYIFSLLTRKNGYEKPVIGGDWRRYSRDMKLRSGDQVTFRFNFNCNNDVNAPRFTIEAQRADLTFQGERLWLDLKK